MKNKILTIKKISILILAFIVVSCSNEGDPISTKNELKGKLLVFKRNTDPNSPNIFSKLYEANPKTGEIGRELGGYEKIQARIYYDIVYLNNEILTKRSTGEVITFNLDNNETTISDFNGSIHNLTVVDGRLYGMRNNINSADLVEIDKSGNVLSVIENFKEVPGAPDLNKTGLENLTFSDDKKLLVIRRRTSFYSGDPNKLFIYNIVTKDKRTINTGDYESIILGNNGRLFALKRELDAATNKMISKIVEVSLSTGEEVKDIYTFSQSLFDFKELTFFSNSNQIMVGLGLGYGLIDVNTGKLSSVDLTYEYRHITGFNAVRYIGF
ncbi:hypothetical protein [Tenacibaculum agarivorans]|uniref:hypothetical protein n=1 Tax=Tenacibaculum agarivorans TaxID=1908389 RepID=UPI00094BBB58|nr:hypothetical protein [Tenacibaculum agarivorans]